MSLPFTVIDSFTNKPFGGNPAAVIVLPDGQSLPDSLLQSIALEFNLSETAFIKKQDSDGSSAGHAGFGLRWFTPQREVDLCGHATLASAAVLFKDQSLVPGGVEEIHFFTRSGTLVTRRVPGSNQVEMEFPVGDIIQADNAIQAITTNSVLTATGLSAENIKFIGSCDIHPYHKYVLVEIDAGVNLSSLKVVPSHLVVQATEKAVIVITNQVRAEDGSLSPSFNLRVFAPLFGIDEDPVTGSACSFATKYWAEKSGIGANKPFPVRQVSARVGDLEVLWNEAAGTAKLRGEARVATKGDIYIS